jgi:FtsH-binding integral membrane protein
MFNSSNSDIENNKCGSYQCMPDEFLNKHATSSTASSVVSYDRSNLMAKVYAIISCQLLVTFCAILPMYLHKKYVINHTPEFFWPSCIFTFVMLFVVFITTKTVKLIMSFLFSGAMGVMIGSAIVRYDAALLMEAVLITLTITISCSLFVHITKVDLHSWGGILFGGLVTMFVTSLIFVFFPPSHLINIVYCVCGIVLFIGYILFDTSEMRTLKYLQEDTINDAAVIIALNIYLDIINMFIYIIQLLDALNND